MSDNQRAKRLIALIDDIRAESDQPVFDHTACAALSGTAYRPLTCTPHVDSDVVDYLLRK